MSTKKKDKRFSVGISEFCKLVDAAKRDYDWNSEEVNRLDKLTQDYLHQLELDGLDYRGRAKVATNIAECRRTRRTRKDVVEVLEPLVEFLNSDKGKNMVNLLREVLGKTRKVEERMETRTYRRKVLDQPAVHNKGQI